MSKITIALLALLVGITGCRKEDVRRYTFSIPGLTENNTNQVANALFKYLGVKQPSLKFDLTQKTLTLEYDSMLVALTNLRMAVADLGIEVEFPPNSPVAGYVPGSGKPAPEAVRSE